MMQGGVGGRVAVGSDTKQCIDWARRRVEGSIGGL